MGYMATEKGDFFSKRAENWDMKQMVTARADKFVRRIMEQIAVDKHMTLMDFGCGTGLVGLQFAPYVEKLVMVDNSPAMLEKLQDKIAENRLDNVTVFETIKSFGDKKVDAIVSLMAFHHVENIDGLILQMYHSLNIGGYVAIGDLTTEDGDFHNEEVPHHGFDQQLLCRQLSDVGFQLQLCEIFNTDTKNTQKGVKEFPEFIIIAKKIS